jgi:hypothetical protein
MLMLSVPGTIRHVPRITMSQQGEGGGVEAFRTRVQREPVHRITIGIRAEYNSHHQEGGIDDLYPQTSNQLLQH